MIKCHKCGYHNCRCNFDQFDYDVILDHEKHVITIGTMSFSFQVINVLSEMNKENVELMYYANNNYFKFIRKEEMPSGYFEKI